ADVRIERDAAGAAEEAGRRGQLVGLRGAVVVEVGPITEITAERIRIQRFREPRSFLERVTAEARLERCAAVAEQVIAGANSRQHDVDVRNVVDFRELTRPREGAARGALRGIP